MTIFKVGDTVLSDPESRKEIGSGAEGVAYLCQGLVIKEINKT